MQHYETQVFCPLDKEAHLLYRFAFPYLKECRMLADQLNNC